MIQSNNLSLLLEATKEYSDIIGDVDLEDWLKDKKNVMYEDNGSVGLASYEYPGLFSVHWFYKVRGRAALNLAIEMLDDLFRNHGAEAVRGVTKVDLKGARWACRQLGYTSYGIMPFKNGDCELFCMTKDEFYSHNKRRIK